MSGRSEPPARPSTVAEAGFVPQAMTSWLGPASISPTIVSAGLAALFGTYADRRETQGVLDAGTVEDRTDQEACWVDFVGDAGDGFDAAYTVAHTASAPTLEVDGLRLPRGEILVFGGDQVYPSASIGRYRDRLLGPWRAALPWVPDGPDDPPVPSVYALPGNHDWYDGLTSFLRVFGQQGWVGGRRLRQSRSYFAMRLPGRWWLLGLDTQLGGWLDRPQLDWFGEQVARHLTAEDRIILCVPQPVWAKTHRGEATEALAHFRRRIVDPSGAKVQLVLTGDKHHYARYETDEGVQLVTSGGGGAYLAATHHEPSEVDVGFLGSGKARLAATYPSDEISARLGDQVFGRMVPINREQTLFFALLHALAGRRARRGLDGVAPAWKVAIVGGLGLFGGPSPTHRVLGAAHGLAHAFALGGTARLARRLGDGPLAEVVAAVLAGGGGVLTSQLLATYLRIEDRAFGQRDNELFAAMALPTYKHFLRLEVASSGTLVVHPVGIDEPPRWRIDPSAGDPGDPWFVPDGPPPRPHLVEPPFVVGAGSAG